MGKQESQYKMYWRCRMCGTLSPIEVMVCQNPDCEADLLLHGEQVFEGEEPPRKQGDDIAIEEVQQLNVQLEQPSEQRMYTMSQGEPPRATVANNM